MGRLQKRVSKFLFPAETDRWVTILRLGVGVQVSLYAVSLRNDWSSLLTEHASGPVSRALTEALLSIETRFTPRLGWLATAGAHLGLSEGTVLAAAWLCLLAAGCLLIAGLFCRLSAIVAWFLYLASVKSSALLSYGVDNFTTIALFYLMIAPFPDQFALDSKLRAGARADRARLGFQRRVLQLHLCIIYFFGGISKSVGADWWTGTSVWRALTRPPFDLIPPDMLIRFEFLLPIVGISVCLLETAYPVFIWIRKTRTFWLIGILLMHLSIGLTMGLYLFALIMIVLNLAAFGNNLFPCRIQNESPPALVSATL